MHPRAALATMPTERPTQDDPNAPPADASLAEAVAVERAPERNVNTRTRPAAKRARSAGPKKAARKARAKKGGGRKRAKAKKGSRKRTAAAKRGARGKTRPGSGKTNKRRAKGR